MAERQIAKIYLHCSDSDWGNQNAVNGWHRARRFLTMVNGHHLSTGYHLIIGSGRPNNDRVFYDFLDGNIETARAFDVQGAGVRGDNRKSIHICLIGKPGGFTTQQIENLFIVLLWFHIKRKIPVDQIWGHYEFWTRKGTPAMKTCPGLDMDDLRSSFQHFVISGGHIEPIRKPNIKPVDSILHAMLKKFDSILGGRA